MATTRIFYATDVHGSEMCFLKFINAGKFYKADVVILGGDITGKMIVPIIQQANGTYATQFLGRQWLLKTQDEMRELESNIRNAGYYPYRTNPEEIQKFEADKARMDELFTRLMVETLERWVKIAEERLKNTSIKCFITPGNDDRFEIDSVLEKSEIIINPEGIVVEVDKYHEMISTGYANITPWKCPRDIPEEELEKKIEAMASKVKNIKNCIFNFHCPPYNTPLDLAPKLKDFKPVISTGGQPIMIPVGSTSVRDAIMNHQPLLGLHGHIHESKGTIKLGRTLCLNPGSEYGEGYLRGAIVNIDEKRIRSFQFTSG